VVVGAGVTGLSIAWHLARLGVGPVVVLERTGIGAEASGVQPGGVRQQWSTRVNCELAIESVAFYRDIDRQLATVSQPKLERGGYLFVADTHDELADLERNVGLQNELGIPSRIVDRSEAKELIPGLRVDGIAGGAYCAEDGYFDKPQGVVEGFAEAAIREGVTIEIAEARGLEPQQGGGWIVHVAEGRTLAVHQVVVASGYDAPGLLGPLGVELPIEKQARYLFFSDAIHERLLEPLVVAPGRRFAAKQLANGRVLASDLGAEGDIELGRQQWRENIAAGIQSLLPVLEFVSFPTLIEGFYDVTPDHQPILGRVGAFEGLWLAVGFSGHGFMFAPAIGRRMAQAVAGHGIDPALAELSLERFRGEELAAELQIV
jgi:sarcosine oxidase subunit beta